MGATAYPEDLAPDDPLQNVPAELLTLPQWVGWKKKPKPDGGFTKIPINAKTGNYAATDDPSTWASFEEALDCLHRDPVDGVGFVLTEDDPYCGIDLDHIRDPQTGHLEPWASEIVRACESRTEVTPSEDGVRIWMKGRLPDKGGNNSKGFEIYDRGRFFTITGEHVPGTPATIEERQEVIDFFYQKYFPDKLNGTGNGTVHSALSEQECIGVLADLKNALPSIPADDHDTWVHVGMGMHSVDSGDAGLSLWVEWSKTCPEKFNLADCLKRWRSFHNDGGITHRSIFDLAIQHGWRANRGDKKPTHAPHEPEPLPTIQTNNRPLRDISGDALRALLLKNNPPSLFVRAGTLARSVTDERDRPIIEAVGEPALRGYLTRSAEFVRITAKDDKKTGERTYIETHVPPPKEVVQDIISLALKPFPPLVGSVESPVFRPDGSILSTGGYDPATRLFYHPTPGFILPDILDKPTAKDARQARQWLQDELFLDFPFADGADVANCYGSLLTPVVRPAIRGNAPLGLIDKPGPGSGATLLADLIATVASGTLAAKLMAPEGRYAEEEWKKRITSFLLLNSAHVGVIDNIEETALSSSALATLLTAGEWQDRLLGTNSMVRLPVRCTLIATGNNIALRGDVARRCYRVWLDPRMERPWTREGFKHADLLGWTRENRGKILAALFTMARAWFVAGQPAPAEKLPTLGMFEEWVRIVGGILAFSGLGGFLENQEALYEQVDDEGPEWRKFLEAWFELWGDRWVTVRYFCGVLSTLPVDSALFQALPEKVEWEPDKLEGSRIKLGKALKKHAFRVYGQYRLERNDENKKAKSAEWKVSVLRS